MEGCRRDFAKGHDYSHGAIQQAIGRNVILEVPDFYGGGDTDVFLDWLQSIESFDFHDIPKCRRLKFVKAKLKGTTKMCGIITRRITGLWVPLVIEMI